MLNSPKQNIKWPKIVRGKRTSKQIVACFFGKTVQVATVPLEQRRTVSSEWYTKICLPKVFGEIRKMNQRRLTIVHHICYAVEAFKKSEWKKCFDNWFKRMQKC